MPLQAENFRTSEIACNSSSRGVNFEMAWHHSHSATDSPAWRLTSSYTHISHSDYFSEAEIRELLEYCEITIKFFPNFAYKQTACESYLMHSYNYSTQCSFKFLNYYTPLN